MGTVFTISFTEVSIAAEQDIFSWRALDDAPLRLLKIVLANAGVVADAGDAKEQMWPLEICRGNTTIGSGGSNPTGRPLRSKDTTTLPTTNLRANDTTKVSAGTRVLLHADAFNTRVGWLYVPPPELIWTFDEGDGFGALQLVAVPNEAIVMSGTCYLEQL